MLLVQSVLRTQADSQIGQVLCTKIIQHLRRYTLFTFHFHQKKRLNLVKARMQVYITSVHNFQINNSNRKCSHRSPAYLRTYELNQSTD